MHNTMHNSLLLRIIAEYLQAKLKKNVILVPNKTSRDQSGYLNCRSDEATFLC